MNATIEDALVNWYEVERSARWWAANPQRDDVVRIGAGQCQTSAALDGLFRAVDDALSRPAVQLSSFRRPRPFAGAATELAWASEAALPVRQATSGCH